MGFLIPAALGALSGIFGGGRKNNEDKQNYQMAQLQRQDQQQALRRRQLVLARLFQQYKFDPTEWGFGNPLAAGGIPQASAPGAEDPYRMAPMPEFHGTPWWQNALAGATGGIAHYFDTPVDRPRATVPSQLGLTGDIGNPDVVRNAPRRNFGMPK